MNHSRPRLTLPSKVEDWGRLLALPASILQSLSLVITRLKRFLRLARASQVILRKSSHRTS